MTTVTTQKIKHEGFTAYILGYAKTDEGFVYLRMVGPHNAVKAIWATLVGAQKTQKEKWQRIQVGPSTGIAPVKGVRYQTFQATLKGGYLDLAMVHPNATIQPDETGPSILYFIQPKGVDGPPPGFFERLNSHLPLPLLPDWEDWLWHDALNGPNGWQTIFPLVTIGVDQVYQVSLLGDALRRWKTIIKKNASLVRVSLQDINLASWDDPLAAKLRGQYADITLDEAIRLYDHVRDYADAKHGSERAAWVILREQLYIRLKQEYLDGVIAVYDWNETQETVQIERRGRHPYDVRNRIGKNAIYATKKMKRHYKQSGDGILPRRGQEALDFAIQALDQASPNTEQSLLDYYNPILAELQQAHAEKRRPDLDNVVEYWGVYHEPKIKTIRDPRSFAIWQTQNGEHVG